MMIMIKMNKISLHPKPPSKKKNATKNSEYDLEGE